MQRSERVLEDRTDESTLGMCICGKRQVLECELMVGDGGATNLRKVGVLAVHPEKRHARDTDAALDDRTPTYGRGRLVERVERPTEGCRLLASHRAHRFTPGQLVDGGQ